MASFELDFDVVCDKCGATLDTDERENSRNNSRMLYVKPCQDCLKESADEAHESRDDEVTELKERIMELEQANA